MVVRANFGAMFAYRQMGLAGNRMSKALQRLSSGYRINSAADDPAGLAMSERMRAQITAQRQAIRNSHDAKNMLSTAEGALNESHRILNRLTEITTQAATGTLTNEQRNTLQQEVNQLLEELGRTKDATNFNKIDLLKGNGQFNEPSKMQIGPSGNDYDKLEVALPDMNSVLKLLDRLDVTSQEAAMASMDKVAQCVDKVSEMRGDLGAKVNRLEYSINASEEALANLEEAESNIRDADMAKEMMEYVKGQVVSQAAQFMMAHAMQEPYRVLELIKST